jgi:hypothetical protein
MTVSPEPNPFKGVWQRQCIQFDQGPVETRQSVLWIQSQSAFADVRSAPWNGSLTAEGYRTLTWRQKFDVDLLGFAGQFTWSPTDATCGTCTWHHDLAITPRSRPDTSDYRWLGPDTFLEQGTCEDDQGYHHSFIERWYRIDTGPIEVWRMDQANSRGMALMTAAWAVIVSDQRQDLPLSGKSLSFKGFAASAWQKVGSTWQCQFGSPTDLSTPPPWTPETLNQSFSPKE